MSKLTKKDIKKVANLIKLHLSEEELENYLSQLETSLEPVKDFEELDLEGIEVTAQTIGTKNIYREDTVSESLSQEDALMNAKNKKNGYITVKRFIHDGN